MTHCTLRCVHWTVRGGVCGSMVLEDHVCMCVSDRDRKSARDNIGDLLGRTAVTVVEHSLNVPETEHYSAGSHLCPNCSWSQFKTSLLWLNESSAGQIWRHASCYGLSICMAEGENLTWRNHIMTTAAGQSDSNIELIWEEIWLPCKLDFIFHRVAAGRRKSLLRMSLLMF